MIAIALTRVFAVRGGSIAGTHTLLHLGSHGHFPRHDTSF